MKIVAKVIIEIAGFPEDHVKKTMDMVMEKLKAESKIRVIKEFVAEVEKIKEMWSTFADMELEFEDMDSINNFCFDYMPSSIEIMNSEKLHIDANEISNLLNDLLARLHNFTMFLKNLQAENINLKKELEKK